MSGTAHPPAPGQNALHYRPTSPARRTPPGPIPDKPSATSWLVGIPPVPLPGVRQAVERTQRRRADTHNTERRHCPRGVLAPALQAEPAGPGGNVPDTRVRLHLGGGAGVGGEARTGSGGEPGGPRTRKAGSAAAGISIKRTVRVRGQWRYLYRAIDRDGGLVDVMLSEHRDLAAANAFFRSAKTVTGVTPDRVTTDGHDAYPRAIRTELGRQVRHRTSCYLNNKLEQDHRGIKGRCRPMLGLKSTASSGTLLPMPRRIAATSFAAGLRCVRRIPAAAGRVNDFDTSGFVI